MTRVHDDRAAFADVLLYIEGYPDETSLDGIADAVRVAAGLGATITAAALAVHIPIQSNWLADHVVGLADTAKQTEALCAASCEERIRHFEACALEQGVTAHSRLLVEDASLLAIRMAREARAYDFCIHLSPLFGGMDRALVEELIFHSGRPVLLLPPGSNCVFEDVVVAWDGGPAAARALNDALPILSRARSVKLALAEGDKPDRRESLAQALRHLERHGIRATSQIIPPDGRPAQLVLEHFLDKAAPDLLVMGAYGHSRVRELILGGVTDRMLSHPSLPVFLSH